MSQKKSLPTKLLVCIFLFCCITTPPVFAQEISTESEAYSRLNIVIQKTLNTSPVVQAAQANLTASYARWQAAKQPLYNPELIAQLEDKHQNSFTDPVLALEDPKIYEKTNTIGINQTVDWTNKRSARSKIADKNYQVAEAQLALIRQQLATELLNALITYQKSQAVLKLSKERTHILQKFVTLTEKREATGDVARVETDLAQLALSESLVQQANSELDLSEAQQVLLAITGLTNTTWPSLPNHLPDPNLVNRNINELLSCLPEIQSLNEQHLSAKMRIQLAKRERYPDPTFGLQGGKENTNEGSKKVFMATFSIPLFIRNSYKAEVTAANFEAIEAQEKQMGVMRQLTAGMISSAERYRMLYKTVQEWQQIANKPLINGMVLIERLWQAGEMGTTDYLIQIKQRLDSQIAGAQLRGRAWQAWGDWLKASGTVENWLEHNQ